MGYDGSRQERKGDMEGRPGTQRPQGVETLAVFGGPPAFDTVLHVGRPNLGDRAYLLQRIHEALDRRWLTNGGPLVLEFEREVARVAGTRHCVALCSGTMALEIAVRAAGLRGEVIVPSFTFVATAHALQWQGITPVFCDIDPGTHTIDPERVEERITGRTSGIIGVHTWGRPCDVDALTDVAKRNGLVLLFDAAHAFGCSAAGRMIGGFGRAEIFSFHATKFVNCLEGGAVVTDDDAMAASARLMRDFGFVEMDTVAGLGTNGKMNEFSAAMGLTTLRSMEAIVAHNREVYRAYRKGLAGLGALRLIEYDESEKGNYQYIVVEVDEKAAGLSRSELLVLLHAENVLARRYFFPGCHRMEPYRTARPEGGARLPQTERLVERVLVLPTGEVVSVEHAEAICGILRTALENAPVVREKIEGHLRAGKPSPWLPEA